jgi:succinate-semialdehyde dehydrogenase/glutarate-semialdehyde dehydrogenase
MSTATLEHAAVQAARKMLYIDGDWRQGSERTTLPVEDPATGEILCEVADATPGDAMAALDAAAVAQPSWARASPQQRANVLGRACREMSSRADELALILTLEGGKPLAESRGEIAYAAEYLRFFAGEALRLGGAYGPSPDGQGRVLVMRQPVGPCLVIVPWNFPLVMAARAIAPALAAGCTLVVKSSRQTPLSTIAVADVLERAGLPPGVLNVVVSSSSAAVTTPLIEDPRLRKLTFTGSTAVGRRLMAQAAERVLRVSMELGGNAPFVVFEDADLEAAAEGALVAKMRNCGQACTSANRFLVAERVAEEFTARLSAKMAGLTVGRGTEPDVQVGPLIDADQCQRLGELVDDALGRGARVVMGDACMLGPGYFYSPTVLDRVPADARLLREEIFGPVAPVASFASEEDAIRAANATDYGLAAFVYTRDLDRAIRVVESVETGMVGLNQGAVSNPMAPFGGVKASGVGRAGGPEGIGEYLETKYVALAAN